MAKTNENYDLIVVGSGPGGATVARETALRGKKVLLLEWGSDAPITGSPVQAGTMMGVPGKSMLFTYKGLSMVRGITAGGSSVFYYATAFEPPYEMLKAHGVDLAEDVEAVKKQLPIAPLDDRLIGPMAKRIGQSARDLGYNWQKLQKYVFQDKCLAGCDRCNLGCPNRAKWTARNWIEEAVEHGTRFVAQARVRKVIVEGNKATGVLFTRRGTEYRASADTVVISAGGIGTPVILRASGIPEAGYDYFFDPLIAVFGTAPDVTGGTEFPMAMGVHMADEGYLMTDMTLPRLLYQAFASELLRFDRLMAHPHTLTIMVKAKDTLGGRLTDSGGVRKHLAPADEAKLMKGYERAKGILKHAGASHIFKSWFIAAHPGGTAKIGDVVDSSLKTKFDNLYVCDCSVIPEAWGLPPSLTLLALGRRLARMLAAGSQAEEKAA